MSLALRHIATFGSHEVYVGADDNWTVKSGPHWCDTLALQEQQSLSWLPLLEYDYGAVQAALVAGLTRVNAAQAAQRVTTFPVQDLLRVVFMSGCSPYWIDLALDWAAQIALPPDLRHYVHTLAVDQAVPQPTRHRAKRLYYTGKG